DASCWREDQNDTPAVAGVSRRVAQPDEGDSEDQSRRIAEPKPCKVVKHESQCSCTPWPGNPGDRPAWLVQIAERQSRGFIAARESVPGVDHALSAVTA